MMKYISLFFGALTACANPVFADPQPTATEAHHFRLLCAEDREGFREGWEEEVKKFNDKSKDLYLHATFASNYNEKTNRCYLEVAKRVTYVPHKPDGSVDIDSSIQNTDSWTLYDFLTSREPIAYCSYEDKYKKSFTPRGEVSAKEACAYIDNMMQVDSGSQ